MFDWFTGKGETGGTGLEKMWAEFGQMLDAGRHAFDTAANAFLGGTDVEVIRADLFKTDKRINRAERQIRRQIVVHASVHGAAEFPACLVLMSIVKDAERVGDYGKNLFDLTELAPHAPEGEHRESLVRLKDRISEMMAACREVFDSNDKEVATELIVEAKKIEDLCDEKVRTLVRGTTPDAMAPTYVLAYRYFKRVTSHVRNVASSVVQPLHKLDFTSKITAEAATQREATQEETTHKDAKQEE
ncbi:MAG TPA: PhoU domain-containing protein [Thermoguttaceae bacterium]|nr:PhoU domain-containing protein [Thermoguttaceae bacterium]